MKANGLNCHESHAEKTIDHFLQKHNIFVRDVRRGAGGDTGVSEHPSAASSTPLIGATENAGVENAIRSKMQGWKMREWKIQEQTTRVENTGVEKSGADSIGGKCGSRQAVW